MKRFFSTWILIAFVVVDAVPCSAAFMACGMKWPVAGDRCGLCAVDSPGASVLTATSCCRVEPGSDRSTAPAILSGNAAGSGAAAKVLAASLPAALVAPATAIHAAPPAGPSGLVAPLPRSSSTVLRL